MLSEGRKGNAAAIYWASAQHAALDYYDGILYQVPGFRQAVVEALRSGEPEFLILSGAYGMLFPEEPIHNYEKPLNAPYWVGHRLPEVIEELVEKANVETVYGFLPKTTDYRKIFEAVDWGRLKAERHVEHVGLFSPQWRGGGAQVGVPRLLGEAIVVFISTGLSERAVCSHAYEGGTIRFCQLGV